MKIEFLPEMPLQRGTTLGSNLCRQDGMCQIVEFSAHKRDNQRSGIQPTVLMALWPGRRRSSWVWMSASVSFMRGGTPCGESNWSGVPGTSQQQTATKGQGKVKISAANDISNSHQRQLPRPRHEIPQMSALGRAGRKTTFAAARFSLRII